MDRRDLVLPEDIQAVCRRWQDIACIRPVAHRPPPRPTSPLLVGAVPIP
ncbi:MAG: hypothetical protein M5R42_01835 [Rhodocyclaceae bacterium]|nr:hypothetical protein [Rhodocyclaceae bacterium]